jgi:hypothetical protein
MPHRWRAKVLLPATWSVGTVLVILSTIFLPSKWIVAAVFIAATLVIGAALLVMTRVFQTQLRRLAPRPGGPVRSASSEPAAADVPVGANEVEVRLKGRPLAARVSTAVCPSALVVHNYEKVRNALDDAGVHSVVVSKNEVDHVILAIASDDWPVAVRALCYGPIARGLHVRTDLADVQDKDLAGDFRLGCCDEAARAVLAATHVAVFDLVAEMTTDRVFGPEFACEVQRWRHSSDHADLLIAPHRNQTADVMSLQTFGTARSGTNRLGFAERRPARAMGPDAFSVDFPIDVVYTWVDDRDPVWLKKLAAARPPAMGQPATAPAELRESEGGGPGHEPPDAPWRFRAGDELLHSMRSIEMYMPWVHHIFLVTDDQAPVWLDLESDRVTVVTHREIFRDPSVLPVFNSQAIGSQLHHIPGLSEHYLYMNDDFFITSPVGPERFFGPGGLAKFTPSRHRRRLVEPERYSALESARLRSASLLSDRFGRTYSHYFAHVPYPQVKSAMTALETEYPEVFATTAESKFRSRRDYEVNCWLHLNYLLSLGRATESTLRYAYLELTDQVTQDSLTELLGRRDLDVVCINDAEGAQNLRPPWLGRTVADFFAPRASFELAPDKHRSALTLHPPSLGVSPG